MVGARSGGGTARTGFGLSLKIEERRVESLQEPEAQSGHVLKGNNVEKFPAVKYFPESEWRYGVYCAVRRTPEKIQVHESPVPANPFLAESVPVTADTRSISKFKLGGGVDAGSRATFPTI